MKASENITDKTITVHGLKEDLHQNILKLLFHAATLIPGRKTVVPLCPLHVFLFLRENSHVSPSCHPFLAQISLQCCLNPVLAQQCFCLFAKLTVTL